MTRNNQVARNAEFIKVADEIVDKTVEMTRDFRIHGYVAYASISAVFEISDSVKLRVYTEDWEGAKSESVRAVPIYSERILTLKSNETEIMEIVYRILARMNYPSYYDNTTGKRMVVIYDQEAEYYD